MSYTPVPPPFAAETAIARYTYDELLRIAQALEEAGGVSLLDFHGITSSNSVPVNKFGKADDVDSGAYSDIWDKNGGSAGKIATWQPPTVATNVRLSSTSGTDSDPSGTGARTVRVYGLDAWDGKEVYEDFALNGTSVVVGSQNFVIVHRMQVLTTGSTGQNTGSLLCVSVADGYVTAQINPGEGQTLMAIYGVPDGKTLYVTNYYTTLDADARSLSGQVRFRVNDDPVSRLNKFVTKNVVGPVTEGSSFVNQQYAPFLAIDGPAIIKMDVEPFGNDNIVTGGFDGYLKG